MIRIATIALVVLAPLSLALAVDSVNVEQSSTAQFQEGTFEDVVVNNLGELKLARKLDVLLKDDKDVVFVNAMVADDKGNVYAATAPNGKLFRVSPDGQVELWWTAKEKTLLSLALGPKGELYVGTGGGEGKVYRVAARNTAVPVLEKDGLAYVWSMVVLPDGRLVAGTGPKAELIIVTPDDKPSAGEVLFAPDKDKQKNILSVAADAAGKTVYFGTDVDGLVFKFDLAARKPFLLYDAEQSEISAILVAGDGSVYAATSDPAQVGGEGGPGGEGPARAGMAIMGGGPDGMSADEGKAEGDDRQEQDDDGQQSPPAQPSGKSAPGKIIKVDTTAPTPGKPRPADAAEAAEEEAVVPSADKPARLAPASQPDKPARTGKAPGSQPEGTTARPRDGMPPSATRMARGGPGGRMGPGGPGGEGEGGNAVYKIDSTGFVTDVVRQPALILSMILDGEQLIIGVGGGDGGKVIAVKPGSDEVATLARPKDVKQVMALARGRDGGVLIGTANNAIIARVGAGYANKGTFTSKPIDARVICRWGVVSQKSNTSAGGSVQIQTRSGNLAEPVDSLWSAWSEPAAASEPVAINSPPARFIQYRVVISSDKPTVTPVVDSVSLSYISENRAPRLTAATVVTPGSGGDGREGEGPSPRPTRSDRGGPNMPPPSRMPSRPGMPSGPGGGDGESGGAVSINWVAADPNDDQLETMLYFRKAGSQVWIPLFDKPIRESSYQWPTRGLPDGQYQVKVVVSDLPSNPAGMAKQDTRLTDVFTIDNTPPVINNLRVVETRDGVVTLAADANDALSRLTGAHIKIDSVAIDGQAVLPVDGIWDQKSEALRFTVDLSGKPAGGHMVILTVTDLPGNVATAAIEIAK